MEVKAGIKDVWGKRSVSQMPYWVIKAKVQGINVIPNMFTTKQSAVEFLRSMQASWHTQAINEKVNRFYEIVRM